MLNTTPMTRNFTSLLCVMGLFAYACGADTIATYSGQYAADLEQKQELLQSISEDVVKTDSKTIKTVEDLEAKENIKMSRFNSARIGLAEIIPHTEKINIACVGMSGTLSPAIAYEGVLKDRNNSNN